MKKERHGKCYTPVYEVWKSMKQRCLNPNNKDYRHYGGRGITVCERWASSFQAFASDMGPRPAGMTLDRTDNIGPYDPANCQWATWEHQRSNTRPRAYNPSNKKINGILISQVLALRSSGMSHEKIAATVKIVGRQTVGNICRGAR